MTNSIEPIAKNQCCGCGACAQICPKKAISLIEDEEGFLYPKIDKKKCINCGLCKKVCPFINYKVNEKKEYPKAYAVKNKKTDDVLKSSSGGVFIALAKHIINEKGVVFGVAYDKDNNVIHIAVDNTKDLIKLQGSKYVQSNILNTFNEVKENLLKDKKVLFSGTPCQIRGLKNFLMKDYENLITCDLVCHGVPSQKLFNKYLSYLENKYNKKIRNYDFRNKEKKGWGLISKVIFEDNSIKYINSDFDPYYSNFLDCNTYRESCYNCKFASTTRSSDITLADYWGILSIHNSFYDKNGVSLILINSEKGNKYLDKIKNDISIIETDLNYAISKNKNLKQSSIRPNKRTEIYKNIDKEEDIDYVKNNLTYKVTLKKVIKILIPNKLKKSIMRIKGMKK